MALSPNQIGAYILESGWQPVGQRISGGKDVTPADVKRKIIAFYDTAIAICLAESGGNPAAKNPGSSASGLWQIMVSVHGELITRAKQEVMANDYMEKVPGLEQFYVGRVPTIFHPSVNTHAARMVYQDAKKKGDPWMPWEVYYEPKGNPAYKKHLGHGAKVYAYLSSPAVIAKGTEALMTEAALGIGMAQIAIDPTGAIAGASKGWDMVQPILEFIAKAGMTAGAFVLGALLIILGIWFVISQTKAGKAIKGVTPVGKVGKLLK